MKVGYIGGTFDLTHYGHYELFKKCKKLCDYLIVSVNTDAFCKEYKREPVLNIDERIRNLYSCKYIDEIIVNKFNSRSDITISNYMESSCRHIDYIMHGDDWTGKDLKKQMNLSDSWLESKNMQMVYVDNTDGISTTDIINRIKKSK